MVVTCLKHPQLMSTLSRETIAAEAGGVGGAKKAGKKCRGSCDDSGTRGVSCESVPISHIDDPWLRAASPLHASYLIQCIAWNLAEFKLDKSRSKRATL